MNFFIKKKNQASKSDKNFFSPIKKFKIIQDLLIKNLLTQYKTKEKI